MGKLPKKEVKRIKREGNFNLITIFIIFACIAITCLLNC